RTVMRDQSRCARHREFDACARRCEYRPEGRADEGTGVYHLAHRTGAGLALRASGSERGALSWIEVPVSQRLRRLRTVGDAFRLSFFDGVFSDVTGYHA